MKIKSIKRAKLPAVELEERLDEFYTKSLPQDAIDGLYSVGYTYFQHKKYAKAAKYFELLCFKCPLEATYFLALGACAEQLEMPKEALELYSQAVLLEKTAASLFAKACAQRVLGLDAFATLAEAKASCTDTKLLGQIQVCQERWSYHL